MENNVNKGDFMRLYNIYYTCKLALPCIKNLHTKQYSNGSYKFENWISCKEAFESLFSIDFISPDIYQAYNIISPIIREQNSFDVGPSTFSEFDSFYRVIVNKITAVIDLYESMKDGSSHPGIDIKIPPCSDFKKYIDILKDLDFILSQCPYLQCESESLSYAGTDIGSDWIAFTLVGAGVVSGTFYILNNLAALINKAIALKSNKKLLDEQEEIYKAMQAKNEVTQEVLDAFRTMKTLTYKKYVNELQEEISPVADGEEEGKVEKSLEKLANLIDKGVEIYTSIETPKEIKVLFPFSDKQESLPDNLLKYLEDKLSDQSE